MREFSSVTTMSSRGQIVIPKPIREALHLVEGEQFDIRIEGNRLVLTPHSRIDSDWRTLQGGFGRTEQTVAEIMAENRREELANEKRKFEKLRP
jgi:AbrB family looped-hinge helix DNA binding protein